MEIEECIEKDLSAFEKTHLKNKVKNNTTQWTVFAGIYVRIFRPEENPASLSTKSSCGWRSLCTATGTSCLNPSQLNTTNDEHFYKLHDSHAEVLVRRAFIQ